MAASASVGLSRSSTLAERARGSVVEILGAVEGSDETSYGTGFAVREKNLVVTNAHVVRGVKKPLVRTRDGATYASVRVLESDDALDHVLSHLKPGATVVASGLKWAPPWAVPVNLFVWPAARRSVSSLAGLHRPWQKLARRVGEPERQTMLAGAVYLARARVPAKP